MSIFLLSVPENVTAWRQNTTERERERERKREKGTEEQRIPVHEDDKSLSDFSNENESAKTYFTPPQPIPLWPSLWFECLVQCDSQFWVGGRYVIYRHSDILVYISL